MLIDGFTVCAQIVNFLVLVWLLKRFLYCPVLDAIEARQKLIAAHIRSAEEQQAAAHAERLALETKNESLDAQRELLLTAAMQEAEEQRLLLLAHAREEADALRKSFEKQQVEDYAVWKRGFVQRSQMEIMEIVRRVLCDLADSELEAQIITVLARRLSEVEGQQKSQLVAAIRNGTLPITVNTCFRPSEQSQNLLNTTLAKVLNHSVALQFRTDDRLICGVEVDLGGRRVSWNVSDYLDQLARAIDNSAFDKSVVAV